MRMMKIVTLPCPIYLYIPPHPQKIAPASSSTGRKSRRAFSFSALTLSLSALVFSNEPNTSISWVNPQVPKFLELPNSSGVKALDLRIGDGETPRDGDVVAIHYYGRLAAKQGWRFDSTYDHKDETGEPIPFSFVLGSGKVISGIETAVRSMKVCVFIELLSPHLKDIRIHPKNPCHLIIFIGKDFLLPFSTQPVLQMEKARHWGQLYLILN